MITQVANRRIKLKRRNAKILSKMMSIFSSLRTEEIKPPFNSTGIDLFGPVLMKLRRARIKRWVALFTCFATQAVHRETVEGLHTDSFINVLVRFRNFARKSLQICSQRKHHSKFQPISIAENGWFIGENCEGSDVQISQERDSHGLPTSSSLHRNQEHCQQLSINTCS